MNIIIIIEIIYNIVCMKKIQPNQLSRQSARLLIVWSWVRSPHWVHDPRQYSGQYPRLSRGRPGFDSPSRRFFLHLLTISYPACTHKPSHNLHHLMFYVIPYVTHIEQIPSQIITFDRQIISYSQLPTVNNGFYLRSHILPLHINVRCSTCYSHSYFYLFFNY